MTTEDLASWKVRLNSFHLVLLTAKLVVIGEPASGPATITGIGGFAGVAVDSVANDVSADGTAVVGA